VWGGESTFVHHEIGDKEPLVKYIDFNCVFNETWLHEGYLEWDGGMIGDCLSMDVVPRVLQYEEKKGTMFRRIITPDGKHLVVPSNAAGDINPLVDIRHPNKGLVYMPDSDEGDPPTAFWDAEYDPETQRYINIRPNAGMKGRYNIFWQEDQLARFVNEIPLLKNGFIALNSSDTDELGHGMRLKITGDTSDIVDDHEWACAFILCLHRKKIV
jgi:hypothetical protein